MWVESLEDSFFTVYTLLSGATIDMVVGELEISRAVVDFSDVVANVLALEKANLSL